MPNNDKNSTTVQIPVEPETAAELDKVVDDATESEDLEQAVIQAEIEAGKAVLTAQRKLQRARDKLNESLQPDAADNKGYGVKVWAGTKILQCLYCPLDVPADEEDRMNAHIAAAHPNFQSEKPLYDNLGNALD